MLKPLKEKFPFEHWHTRGGEFLGKHVQQHEDGRITISQKEYSMSVSCLNVGKVRRKQKDSFVTEQEKTQMRALLGEVNWIAMNSRPDLAASCSLLQQKTSNAKVEDLIECNRLASLVRDFAHGCVTIHPIPPSELEFAVWSDASWAHATDKKSQGGYLIMAASRELRIEGQLVLHISPSLEELSAGPASGFYSWC